MLLFIEIIRRNYTRIYDTQNFSYPDVGVIKNIIFSLKVPKLADVDPAGTLDSCYG